MDTDPVLSSSLSLSFETSNQSAMVTPGDMEPKKIEVPSPNDVLCGRGGSINSHQGNEQFRDLVEKRKRLYLTARFKREKRLIASSIVSEIREMNPPGRFLARHGNKDSGYWYDIGDEKARDKTSQALRENAPSIRAEIETEINEQRAEQNRKETVVHGAKPPPGYAAAPQPYYPHAPPPPHHQSQQSYWDWYHQYYGYPPPAQMPPQYPHPPHQHPTHPPHPGAHPPPAYWGQPVAPTSGHEQTGEEFKDDGMADMMSQEEEDRRMAMELQQEEKAALYEARKARYKGSLARRSNACLSFGSNPRPQAEKPRVSHVRRQPPPFEPMESTDMTQEQQDHRLAVSLQDQEDNVLRRQQLQSTGESSRKSSRSSAHYGSLEQVVPASFVAWVTNDAGAKPKATTLPPPRRSVQFKDDDLSGSHISHGAATLQRQSSTASADRPLLPQAPPNSSLLSQVANHIMGSWDSNGAAAKPPHYASLLPMHDPHDVMETEGLEVQLRDPQNETSMPPPSPRVQIDWQAKTANNSQSWIPESFNTTWTSAPHGNHSLGGSNSNVGVGISPVNSLDMDGSNNNISVGGGSLCHLFDQDESLQRALREVPSWERSMRSKSPLSLGSMEDSDISMIRVREMKLFRSAARVPELRSAGSGDMDWEDHPEQN
jgi:hypothetical protein